MGSARRVGLLVVLFSSVQLLAASDFIHINESEIKAVVTDKDISVGVEVWNDSEAEIPGTLYFQLLDPNDLVVSTSKFSRNLRPGSNAVSTSVPRPARVNSTVEDPLPWYRLRYRFEADQNRVLSGLVALSTIAPDVYELRIAHPDKALPGHLFEVRIHAANPVTRKAIAGVQVRGRMEFDSADKPIAWAHATNSSGDAVVAFRIPAEATDGGSVTIEAHKGDQIRKQDFDFELDPRARIIINTDKLLYQPGQSLHARALILSLDKRAIANEAVEFKLLDPDNNTVLTGASKTNDFGIANVDWELPDSVLLGPYFLQVELSNDRYGSAQAATNVRISRYDLPNFTVTAKPDRSYYLPGQSASIEVTAKYLFGKELTRGSVKLVREEEGHWDSTERKWVVNQADTRSGELDGSGSVKFTIHLADLQAELSHERYRRFQDLSYAAYVSDPTTGKTEQRRFQVRLTREPIHVYVSRSGLLGDRAFFYISTYYPDGIPAECEVSISEGRNHYIGYSDDEIQSAGRDFLRTIKTNRLGVAKIYNLQISTDPDNSGQYHGYPLIFEVRDRHGASTTYNEVFWDDSHDRILLTTDKALYGPNEQILLSAQSSHTVTGRLVVDVSRDGAVIWSGKINLHNHHGFTVIPFAPEFTGELTISAYSLETAAESRYEIPFGVRTVLFPHPSTLSVKVKMDRATYKPGDDVSAALNVRLPSGSSSASALGIVVVDKAVQERIRTDEEFGNGHYGFWDWSWWYPSDSVGGITLKDLEETDLSKPLPDGMDLVAEMLLLGNGYGWADLPEIEGNQYGSETESLFRNNIKNGLERARKALLDDCAADWNFATNLDELKSVLRKAGIKPEDVVDPWGAQYRYSFGLDDRNRTITITSAGPDKKFGTPDDIEAITLNWPYFKPVGNEIDRAVKEIYASSVTYIRDLDGLQVAMIARGVDLKQIRDPWGNPYKFEFQVNGSVYEIVVSSRGAHASKESDSIFSVWTSSIDYFERARNKIDAALFQLSQNSGIFPQDDSTFDSAMRKKAGDFRNLVDPWGHAYYVKYSVESEYGDTTQITYRPDAAVQTGTPVTRKLAWIRIMSRGPDGKPGSQDDFSVASFSRAITEQSGKQLIAQPVTSDPLSGNSGAINGTVTDQTGAAIANATVVATLRETTLKFTTKSDQSGSYIIRNIPPGIYDVSISAPGFRLTQVRTVPVHSTSMTAVNVVLNVGAATETVEVAAEAVGVETTSASVSQVKNSAGGTKVQVHEETFTPRLRDYFPETLYWSPSVMTDASGRAHLKFKLADNITTWKMTVLASTKNGEIGVTDSEIQVFQPFFLEHDPPKVLTVGDLIELPIVVRNYTAQTQQLNLEMKPASWFDLERAGKQSLLVNAGESATAVFPFRATAMVKSGKQQVYAANRSLGDAIEKTLTVHPDGMEQHSTVSGIIRGNDDLSLHIPPDFISGSLQAQLKIYPNLLAHVTESIEAGLERPYGCGEQTISSTYPSVMLLNYYKASGVSNGPLQSKANRYVNLGYHRLLNYREPSGGFSYWGHDSADVALTAYAIRFLTDASRFIEVDPEIVQDAQKWLGAQQNKDGSWQPRYGEDDHSLTAYVTVTLAGSQKQLSEPLKKPVHDAVTRALAYLADSHRRLSDPYALAEFAIGLKLNGDEEQALAVATKLSSLATPEHAGMYWALERNTPFYGWGNTGRIESTAMAVLALSMITPAENHQQIDAGTLWLLQQKDHYGVWYSGQATVNVLEALLKGIDSFKPTHTKTALNVTVNGRVKPVQVSSGANMPVLLDISDSIQSGENAISVRSSGGLTAASAQVVADYYVPWADTAGAEATRLGKVEALRLAVHFDKTEIRAGDEVRCAVDAERIGNRGWGMMIAEIGLPPGADVDRRVLDDVISNSGWEISHYDLLPDKLVLYLWPRAGGTKLTFSFHPRYGLRARTAPSVLYDYYNPDAEVDLAPADFRVDARPRPESQKVAAAR